MSPDLPLKSHVHLPLRLRCDIPTFRYRWLRRSESLAFIQSMDDTADTAHVIIRPPLAWGIAVIAGLALNWLLPLPFLPVELPTGWLGAMVFVLALALFAWAIITLTKAG